MGDDALYRDILIEHSRHPRCHGELESPSHQGRGHNPLCGDKIELDLELDEDGVIRGVAIRCVGCAISTASASLMAELLPGRSRAEAEALFRQVHAGITEPEGRISDVLGELAALNVVQRYPLRVKCATLPWHTLRQALAGGGAVSTE